MTGSGQTQGKLKKEHTVEQAKVWQSGCNDDGPAVGTAGAGKQTYQLAPLFFHAPALGVDLLQGIR